MLKTTLLLLALASFITTKDEGSSILGSKPLLFKNCGIPRLLVHKYSRFAAAAFRFNPILECELLKSYLFALDLVDDPLCENKQSKLAGLAQSDEGAAWYGINFPASILGSVNQVERATHDVMQYFKKKADQGKRRLPFYSGSNH